MPDKYKEFVPFIGKDGKPVPQVHIPKTIESKC